MATLSQDMPITEELGGYNGVPIIATDIVYEGAMVGDNGAGYGRPLVAGDKFLGHSKTRVNNTSGAAGDKNIQVRTGRYRLVVSLVGVITDVDQPVYASDDSVLTYAAGDGNSFVGVVKRYVSATKMLVEFRPGEQDEWGSRLRITKVDNYTTLIGENGKVIYLSTDAKTITLIATVAGHEIIVVNQAAFGAALITVDPNAGDKFLGGCGLAAAADGENMTNTKVTQQRGDYLHLLGDGTDGWNILGMRGTWAQE